MKRALIQSVKVTPYTSEDAINREGYLSAILAASVTAGTTAKVSVTHCDTKAGDYVAVPDDFIVVGKDSASFTAPALVNFDIDLVGCKRYIKIKVEGPTTATYAVALGDPVEAPV